MCTFLRSNCLFTTGHKAPCAVPSGGPAPPRGGRRSDCLARRQKARRQRTKVTGINADLERAKPQERDYGFNKK